MNLYYKIWIDAIISTQKSRTESANWKLFTLIPISLLMGINLFTIFYWMKTIVNKNLPLFFGIDIFNARPLNGYISIVITFFVPFVILNYLLIFSNNKFELLTKRHEANNSRLYKKYTLWSLGVLIIPIIIQKLFFSIV
ncbi:hypothetical protein HDF24_17145 [Mucilaginibacter sp. X4EP1]|uniref:hypothetical protein n=1 Tax=Mucilaginibacter sp. X4EP1 TaxID=2723092 RepID=UPI0021690390|nr:hypothetical protein [Mucilaginibacter sp. X4EP1]MCS3815784.1 K+-sensing histidine kinase KdpD [Mucilaginibacter sp. X4EP1]